MFTRQITVYLTNTPSFERKYCVPSWMFADNFSRQTDNRHPHNLHTRKGTNKPGHVMTKQPLDVGKEQNYK